MCPIDCQSTVCGKVREFDVDVKVVNRCQKLPTIVDASRPPERTFLVDAFDVACVGRATTTDTWRSLPLATTARRRPRTA